MVLSVKTELRFCPFLAKQENHSFKISPQYLPVLCGTKKPEKYPNAELVDVIDNTDHVCANIVIGKLRMDATGNQETVVPIAVPVEAIRDGVKCLEEVSTGI